MTTLSNRDWVNRWPVIWTPRSKAYREGFQIGYHSPAQLGTKNPYVVGTAEADAWWAGFDGGRHHRKCVLDGVISEVPDDLY